MLTEVPSNPLEGTVQENRGPASDPTAYFRHPFQSFLISHPILTEVPSKPCDHNGPTSGRRVKERCIFSSPLPKFPNFTSYTILTELPSNPCGHHGLTSQPKKSSHWVPTDRGRGVKERCIFSSPPSQVSEFHFLRWQKFLLILATIMVWHRSPTDTPVRVRERYMQKSSHWIPTLPKFLRNSKQCLCLWPQFYSILFQSLYRTDQETPLHIFATPSKNS